LFFGQNPGCWSQYAVADLDKLLLFDHDETCPKDFVQKNLAASMVNP
jgi:hypothetical protein